MSNFVGTWNEHARTKNIKAEKPDDQDVQDIYHLKDPNSIDGYFKLLREGKEVTGNFHAWMNSNPNVGQLKMVFGQNFFTKMFMRFDYLVLDTDYNNYAIVYSDINFLVKRMKMCWVMHRERLLPPD